MLDDPIPAIKQQLAGEILRLAARANAYAVAHCLGIDIARFSDLRHGRVARFSVERLIRMLAAVERRVEVTVVAVGPGDPWLAKLRARRTGSSS